MVAATGVLNKSMVNGTAGTLYLEMGMAVVQIYWLQPGGTMWTVAAWGSSLLTGGIGNRETAKRAVRSHSHGSSAA